LFELEKAEKIIQRSKVLLDHQTASTFRRPSSSDQSYVQKFASRKDLYCPSHLDS